MQQTYRFGDCQLDLGHRRLLIGGVRKPLGGKAFAVLRTLVERRAAPVSKADLLDAVWPGQDVEEGNLPVHISALRKLLGPQAITTVPGRGYLFTLPLHGDLAAPPPAADQPPAALPSRHNLPLHAAPLLGRDADLTTLGDHLDDAALVSVVGASGIGKTRLAQAAAATRVATQADGVWWVELADLGDPAALHNRVASTLGLPVEHAAEPKQALLEGLRSRHMLVVLDNAEHLLDAVADLVRSALATTPGVRWLLTSTEPLKLPTESVYRLGPLAVPPPATPLPAALGYGALALLDERARAADRRFKLTAQTLEAAIDLCRQLDGIALALEMAASRLPWMGVQGVRDRLADRLRLLTSSRRGEPERHRTLRAAFEWSHGLLSPVERVVFRRLAVCRGGFALDQAVAITADADTVDRWAAVDAIGTLVDKSLVQLDEAGGAAAPRFRLLESARLFALARLDKAGESAAVRDGHAQAYAEFAEQAWQSLWAQPDKAWLATVEPEAGNLVAALRHGVDRGRLDWAAPVYSVLCWLSRMLGGTIEVRSWAAQVEALADAAAPALSARLLLALGGVFRNSAPPRVVEWYRRGIGWCDPHADRREALLLHSGAAIALARIGEQQQAQAMLDRANTLADATMPPRALLGLADASAFVALGASDAKAARAHFWRFRDLAIQCGADGALVTASHNLADLALTLDEVDEAVRLGHELVQWMRQQRNPFNLGFALGNLCAALVRQGDLAAALDAGREALPLLRREEQAAWLYDHLALLVARQQRLGDAARLQGFADAARRAQASVPDPNEARARTQTLNLLRQAFAADELSHLLHAGEALEEAQADRLALGDTDRS